MVPKITFLLAPVAFGTFEKLLCRVSFPKITNANASLASEENPRFYCVNTLTSGSISCSIC